MSNTPKLSRIVLKQRRFESARGSKTSDSPEVRLAELDLPEVRSLCTPIKEGTSSQATFCQTPIAGEVFEAKKEQEPNRMLTSSMYYFMQY